MMQLCLPEMPQCEAARMGRYFTPLEEKDPIVGKDGGKLKNDAAKF